MSGGGKSRSSSRTSRQRTVAPTSKTKKGGGAKTGGSDDPCDLNFESDLEGIQPAGLAKIKVGDKLDVVIVRSGPYDAVVCRIQKSTEVVGTLAGFPGLATLITCIKQGNKYLATVLKIQRGACTVAVQRA